VIDKTHFKIFNDVAFLGLKSNPITRDLWLSWKWHLIQIHSTNIICSILMVSQFNINITHNIYIYMKTWRLLIMIHETWSSVYPNNDLYDLMLYHFTKIASILIYFIYLSFINKKYVNKIEIKLSLFILLEK